MFRNPLDEKVYQGYGIVSSKIGMVNIRQDIGNLLSSLCPAATESLYPNGRCNRTQCFVVVKMDVSHSTGVV